MKKKLMGALLVATLVVSQAVSVFAAGSANTDVTSKDAVVGEIPGAVYDELDKKVPGTSDAMKEAEKDGNLDALLEKAPELKEELKDGQKLQGNFFDIQKGDAQFVDGKGYEVTLSVPNLTGNWKNVKILHYNSELGKWEVIEVTVDYANKTITGYFKNFSPAGIAATIVAVNEEKPAAGNTAAAQSGNDGTVKSPKTGDWK